MNAMSRRAAMAGIAVAPAALALPAQAQGMGMTTTPELERLIARALAADADCEAFHAHQWTTARERFDRMKAALPHYSFTATPRGYTGRNDRWTTADDAWVGYARNRVKERVVFDGPGADSAREFHGCLRRLVAAATWRERKVARLMRLSGLYAMNKRSEELSDAAVETEDQVLAFAPRSLADLRRKLEFANERGELEGGNAGAWLVADVRRLAA